MKFMMKQKNSTCFLLVMLHLIFLSFYVNAQEDDFNKKFSEVLERQYSLFNDVLPGISIAVVKDDKIIFSKAVGYADLKKNIPADTKTIYYTASCTKPFTGTLAAMFNQSKTILVEDNFTKYLNDINFSDDSIYRANISIKELLTHHSGLSNDPLTFGLAYSGRSSYNEILPVLEKATQYNSNNRTYKYTNLGYNIYSILMKKYLDVDWRDMLEKEIFKPLGMIDTYIYYSKLIENKKTLAIPYNFSNEGLTEIPQMKIDNTIHSAGGIFSTPEDLAKFLIVHINEGRINNKQVIEKDVINRTHQLDLVIDNPPKRTVASFKLKGHGLGWRIGTHNSDTVFYYTGTYPGTSAQISFIPEKKLGVVVMSNEMFAGFLADLLSTYVYDWFNDKSSADELYSTRENQLLKMKEQMLSAIKSHYEKIKSRTWQLELTMNNYAGEYYHEFYGKMVVTVSNGNLHFQFGNIDADATPFENKNSARVEFEFGAGEIITFNINNNIVTGMIYDNYEFKKVK